MAQINFNDTSLEQSTNFSNPTFFSLKNDGDEAIVRFNYVNSSQFKIYTVHNVAMEGFPYGRKVNCIREPKEPLDNCPLCKSNIPTRNVFIVELLQYVTDPNTGNITAIPKCWERTLTYSYKLKGLIDEYGPLSDSIFKIKRIGAAGSRDTTYEIYYCNPKMYPDNLYPADFSSFKEFDPLKGIILNKSREDINIYLTTGKFPQNRNSSSMTTSSTIDSPNQYSFTTTQPNLGVSEIPFEVPFETTQTQRPTPRQMPSQETYQPTPRIERYY